MDFKYGDLWVWSDEDHCLCLDIMDNCEVLLPQKALELAEWIIANQPADRDAVRKR